MCSCKNEAHVANYCNNKLSIVMQAQKTKFFFQQETWVNANMRLVVKVMGRANTY